MRIQRQTLYICIGVFVLSLLSLLALLRIPSNHPKIDFNKGYLWRRLPQRYPFGKLRPLPLAGSKPLPQVQFNFNPENDGDKIKHLERRAVIKEAFNRCWETYKKHAWLADEVTPISANKKNNFGGWAATLVDNLDTLWIMDMKEEFAMATDAAIRNVSFESSTLATVNIFETVIRFLGGLLSAYDLSGDKRILEKARDVGDMIYKTFDTPNHMPVCRWDFQGAINGTSQKASQVVLAEIGSYLMEFMRLSLATGDSKYFDAVQNIAEIMDAAQMKTKLPGLWSVDIDAANLNFDLGSEYSILDRADSAFEYLPKMVALLNNKDTIYTKMYQQSANTVHSNLLFRPMVPNEDDLLLPGIIDIDTSGQKTLNPMSNHLGCFSGGLFGLAGRILSNETHTQVGAKLTRGCIWSYEAMGGGVMPEGIHFVPCPNLAGCKWNESLWHDGIRRNHNIASNGSVQEVIGQQRLPKGVTNVSSTGYLLRPEAIESVFIMYRITGDPVWMEKAWSMWEAINNLTRTDIAYSAVANVNLPKGQASPKLDDMESFWMAETLKYFYLIFSEPDLVNLDEWVFNTEAHPFKRLAI